METMETMDVHNGYFFLNVLHTLFHFLTLIQRVHSLEGHLWSKRGQRALLGQQFITSTVGTSSTSICTSDVSTATRTTEPSDSCMLNFSIIARVKIKAKGKKDPTLN